MKQSIYEIILENSLSKGELKEEFSLPEEDDNIWVVGAKEGVLSHHAGEGEKGPQMLYEAILTRLDEGWESFQDIIEAYAKAYSTFSIIDDLQSWVIAHKEVLDPNAMYRLGYDCLVKSADVEGVKLGFTLLELFSTSHSEKVKQVMLTLASYEEFTLFALYNTAGWTDKNESIWKIAQRVKGWGKIHAVEMLEPTTAEIEEWILCEGCENSILYAYLGLVCAKKCNLYEKLQRPLSENALIGAGIIVRGLLDEGPCSGISIYEHGEEALRLYIQQVDKSRPMLEALITLIEIQSYAKYEGLNLLLEQCGGVLMREENRACILEGIQEKSWQAARVADAIGYNIAPQLFKLMEEDFYNHVHLCGYVFKYHSDIEKVIALAEEKLSFNQIATGMGDERSIGDAYIQHRALTSVLYALKHYPLKGQRLVEMALRSPVGENRAEAIRVLSQWQETLNQKIAEYDETLYQVLKKVAQEEIDEDLKEWMEEFID